jgi:KRAB domain-containing zinc finger protein
MSKKISEYFKILPKFDEDIPKIRVCRVVLKDIKHQVGTNQPRLFDEIELIGKNNNDKQLKSICCTVCNVKICTKFMKRHMRTKHPDGQSNEFECDFDGKIFKTKSELYHHMGVHLPLVECIICRKMLKFNSLYEHRRNFHAIGREFQCKICSKSFKSAYYLKLHEKRHNKEIQCEICNKMFPTVGILNQHSKNYHENGKSFECEICDKKFNLKNDLKIHQKTHEKNRPKPLKCQRCDYATDHQQSFKAHQRFHERQDKKFTAMKNPLKCAKCPTFHRNKHLLKNHMKAVHPDVLLQCDLCAKFIKMRCSLISHIKLHISKISKN